MATGIATNRAPVLPDLGLGRRVLVIEEEPRDRNYIRDVLRRRGFQVTACESVAEGARQLDRGRFDFVVVSQGSHAFEGRLVLERVLDIDRSIPALVLTRCADMKCYMEAMQMGAVDYLEKPLPESEIIRVVETHIRPRPVALA